MPAEDSAGSGGNFRKFVESTSVRGVSRILKSKDPLLRTIWALAVILCGAMLVYQLTRVVNQYLRYEFSTVTKEDIWSQTVRQRMHIKLTEVQVL